MALLRRRKKVVKPTAEEQKKIDVRLQRKYPQMYEPNLRTAQKKVLLRAAPKDRKALEKMVGLRLKRKYRKK